MTCHKGSIHYDIEWRTFPATHLAQKGLSLYQDNLFNLAEERSQE